MKAEEAAKWMDMLCERSLKMDESGKFDQVAALIRAQAEVVEAAKEIPTTDLGPGPYVYVNIRELEALGKALANLRRVEEGK